MSDATSLLVSNCSSGCHVNKKTLMVIVVNDDDDDVDDVVQAR